MDELALALDMTNGQARLPGVTLKRSGILFKVTRFPARFVTWGALSTRDVTARAVAAVPHETGPSLQPVVLFVRQLEH